MPRLAVFVFALVAATMVRAEVTPGEILIAEMNCAACHDAGPLTARLASRQSPRLGHDGVRANAEWLRDFLVDPQKTKPGTLMPDALHALPAEEKTVAAEALTHFLLSQQTPDTPPVHQAEAAKLAKGEALYHSVGCVMCHAPFRLPAEKENDATAKDEFARLQQYSVPLGEGIARKYTLTELTRFLRDPLKARPSGRMPAMNLTDAEAETIAIYLLRDQASANAPFAVDAALVARGKQLFADLNCAACHEGIDSPKRAAKPLAQISARQPRGCLGTRPGENVPKFEINDRQRQVILALLQERTPLNIPLTPEHEIRRTLTALNCYACHTRDRRGGVDGLRREYFTSTTGADLGDEGRIPPTLTRIGAKLRPDWMKTLLEHGSNTRPYIATRMPVFGATNIAHLPALFEQADKNSDEAPAPAMANDASKAGRKLIGPGGLNCVSCHSFSNQPSFGTPGTDLATVPQRLKWDWFRRFLLDPQATRSGTRMPAFWPAGAAQNKDVLGGDVEKQIAAIWACLISEK